MLDQASDKRLVEQLRPHLNINRFVTFWALEMILGHNDGYTCNNNNFYIYLDPDDNERITFIPWGFENGGNYEYEWSAESYFQSRPPRRLSRIPEIVRQLEKKLDFLLGQAWDENYLISLIDHLALQVETAEMSNQSLFGHHVSVKNRVPGWE